MSAEEQNSNTGWGCAESACLSLGAACHAASLAESFLLPVSIGVYSACVRCNMQPGRCGLGDCLSLPSLGLDGYFIVVCSKTHSL